MHFKKSTIVLVASLLSSGALAAPLSDAAAQEASTAVPAVPVAAPPPGIGGWMDSFTKTFHTILHPPPKPAKRDAAPLPEPEADADSESLAYPDSDSESLAYPDSDADSFIGYPSSPSAPSRRNSLAFPDGEAESMSTSPVELVRRDSYPEAEADADAEAEADAEADAEAEAEADADADADAYADAEVDADSYPESYPSSPVEKRDAEPETYAPDGNGGLPY